MKCCYELDIQITEEYKKRVKEVYDLCRDNAKKDVAPDFIKEDFPELWKPIEPVLNGFHLWLECFMSLQEKEL